MNGSSVDIIAKRLSGISVHTRTNPDRRFEWSTAPDRSRPAKSESLLSLADHPLLATLSAEQRWRLGLAEMVHFFSLNIVGERELLAGLARRLEFGSSAAISGYLQHVRDEESAHTAVFAQFCRRYAGKIYPDRQMRLPREFLPGEEEFLFFAQMLIFEEIAAWFNRKLAGDRSLWPLVREINEYHATEEARHLVFGRAMVESLWATSAAHWGEESRQRVGTYLRAYMKATMRSYIDPAVYADVGLPGDLFALRNEVLASRGWHAVEDSATQRIRVLLDGMGISP